MVAFGLAPLLVGGDGVVVAGVAVRNLADLQVLEVAGQGRLSHSIAGFLEKLEKGFLRIDPMRLDQAANGL